MVVSNGFKDSTSKYRISRTHIEKIIAGQDKKTILSQRTYFEKGTDIFRSLIGKTTYKGSIEKLWNKVWEDVADRQANVANPGNPPTVKLQHAQKACLILSRKLRHHGYVITFIPSQQEIIPSQNQGEKRFTVALFCLGKKTLTKDIILSDFSEQNLKKSCMKECVFSSDRDLFSSTKDFEKWKGKQAFAFLNPREVEVSSALFALPILTDDTKELRKEKENFLDASKAQQKMADKNKEKSENGFFLFRKHYAQSAVSYENRAKELKEQAAYTQQSINEKTLEIDKINSNVRRPFIGKSFCGADFRGRDLRGVDFSNADLSGADFTGADLSGADFTGANLQGAKFLGKKETRRGWKANLTDVNFNSADLRGAKVSARQLEGASSFVKAKLSGLDLSGATFVNKNFQEADFRGAQLRGTNFNGANLRKAKLADANLEEALCVGANLTQSNITTDQLRSVRSLVRVNLRGMNFSNADLSGLCLAGANLQRSNLQGAKLRESNLQGANLQRSNLQRADLLASNLQGAKLRGGDLRGADLRSADLRGADLRGGDLQGANLQLSNLQKTHISTQQLEGAFSIVGAKLIGLDLSNINLSKQELAGVNFSQANLTNANLTNANLTNAKLERANLTHANLEGATLLGHVTLKDARMENCRLERISLSRQAGKALEEAMGIPQVNPEMSLLEIFSRYFEGDLDEEKDGLIKQGEIDLHRSDKFIKVIDKNGKEIDEKIKFEQIENNKFHQIVNQGINKINSQFPEIDENHLIFPCLNQATSALWSTPSLNIFINPELMSTALGILSFTSIAPEFYLSFSAQGSWELRVEDTYKITPSNEAGDFKNLNIIFGKTIIKLNFSEDGSRATEIDFIYEAFEGKDFVIQNSSNKEQIFLGEQKLKELKDLVEAYIHANMRKTATRLNSAVNLSRGITWHNTAQLVATTSASTSIESGSRQQELEEDRELSQKVRNLTQILQSSATLPALPTKLSSLLGQGKESLSLLEANSETKTQQIPSTHRFRSLFTVYLSLFSSDESRNEWEQCFLNDSPSEDATNKAEKFLVAEYLKAVESNDMFKKRFLNLFTQLQDRYKETEENLDNSSIKGKQKVSESSEIIGNSNSSSSHQTQTPKMPVKTVSRSVEDNFYNALQKRLSPSSPSVELGNKLVLV